MSTITSLWEWIPRWILTGLNFGQAYPDGDEDKLWELADAWKAAAAELEQLLPDMKAATDSTQKFYIGEGADQAATEFRKLYDGGPHSVHTLAEGLKDLGSKTRDAGTQIEYTKIMEATFAGITAYSVIALIAAWPWGEAAVPAALAAGREAVALASEQGAKQLALQAAKAGLRNAVKPYLKNVAITAVKAGAVGLALDTSIQTYQYLDGHRDNIDLSQAARTAVEWGAGGAVGAGLHPGLNNLLGRTPLSPALRGLLSGGLSGLGGGIGAYGGGIAWQVGDQLVHGNLDWSKIDTHLDPSMLAAGFGLGAMHGVRGAGRPGGGIPSQPDGTAPHPQASKPGTVTPDSQAAGRDLYKNLARETHPDNFAPGPQQDRAADVFKRASDISGEANAPGSKDAYSDKHVNELNNLRNEWDSARANDAGIHPRTEVPEARSGAPEGRAGVPDSPLRAADPTSVDGNRPTAGDRSPVAAPTDPSTRVTTPVDRSPGAPVAERVANPRDVPASGQPITSDRISPRAGAPITTGGEHTPNVTAAQHERPAPTDRPSTGARPTTPDAQPEPHRPYTNLSLGEGASARPESATPPSPRPVETAYAPSGHPAERPDEMSNSGDRQPNSSAEAAGPEIRFDSHLPNGEGVVYRPDRTSIGDDMRTHQVRDNVRNEGEHDVIVHGSPDGAPIPGLGDEVHPEQIVQAILGNPHYVPGTPVRLLACFSGNEFGWAQYIADRLGVPVRAPSDAVGTPRIPNSTAIIRGDGEWVPFTPNTPHEKAGPLHEPGQMPEHGAEKPENRRSAYDNPPGWDFMGEGRNEPSPAHTDPIAADVNRYLNREDVHHVIDLANEASRENPNNLVKVDGQPMHLGDAITTLIGRNPEFVRTLETTPYLESALLQRPRALLSVLQQPEAMRIAAETVNDIRDHGPESVIAEHSDAPKSTPFQISESQRQLVDEIQQQIADLKISTTQPGYHEPISPPVDATGSVRRGLQTALDEYRNSFLKGMYDDWPINQHDLNTVAARVATESGGELHSRPGPKDEVRVAEKVDGKYQGNPSRLTDLVGAYIRYDSISDLYRGLEFLQNQLDAEGSATRVVELKDRFAVPQGSGYGDVQMLVQLSSGHIAEFRMHLRSMDDVAEYEHALYEIRRVLDPLAKEQGRQLTLEEQALQVELEHRARQLYAEALRKGLNE
ncbi:hypothetical protein ACQP06_25245 [Nocardia sp. CA-136227]|uniref:WXG100-like domain-containing protein n=1 Tax=Nocardia sp. CA-136227 TaxID=3239979 RepID=UPI003D97D319